MAGALAPCLGRPTPVSAYRRLAPRRVEGAAPHGGFARRLDHLPLRLPPVRGRHAAPATSAASSPPPPGEGEPRATEWGFDDWLEVSPSPEEEAAVSARLDQRWAALGAMEVNALREGVQAPHPVGGMGENPSPPAAAAAAAAARCAPRRTCARQQHANDEPSSEFPIKHCPCEKGAEENAVPP